MKTTDLENRQTLTDALTLSLSWTASVSCRGHPAAVIEPLLKRTGGRMPPSLLEWRCPVGTFSDLTRETPLVFVCSTNDRHALIEPELCHTHRPSGPLGQLDRRDG